MKVIAGFALCGGMLGAAILYFAFSAINNDWDGLFSLPALKSVILDGTRWGGVPALLTGAWLAFWRVRRTWWGMCHAVAAGALFSLLTAVTLALIWTNFYHESSRYMSFAAAVMTTLGATGALILAACLLPKGAARRKGSL